MLNDVKPARDVVMYEGRLVKLKPATAADYPLLYRWRCDPTLTHYLCLDSGTMVFGQFVGWIREIHRTNIILLVLNKANDQPIGYALTYSVDLWNGWLYFAFYIVPEFRMKRHQVEASLVCADYLFTRFPLRKIYVEIYEFAERLAEYLKNQGWVEEGFTPNHFRHGDGYTGVWTLALYRDTWEQGRPRIEHWLPSAGAS